MISLYHFTHRTHRAFRCQELLAWREVPRPASSVLENAQPKAEETARKTVRWRRHLYCTSTIVIKSSRSRGRGSSMCHASRDCIGGIPYARTHLPISKVAHRLRQYIVRVHIPARASERMYMYTLELRSSSPAPHAHSPTSPRLFLEKVILIIIF